MDKRLAFISADFFVDVDMPVLPFINNNWKLTWYVITFPNARYNLCFLLDFAKTNNIKIEIIQLNCRRRSLSNLWTYLQMYLLIRKRNYDLIYYEYIMDPYIFLFSIFLSSKKKILALHDVLPHCSFFPKSHLILHKLAIHSFVYFQTFSNSQASILKSLYKKESFIIPLSKKDSGAATNNRTPIEDCVKFLFFGGIHFYKRLDILIQAIDRLSITNNNRGYLTIAGQGPHWAACEKYIINKNRFNLKIGFVDQSDVPNLFNEHHFLILPYQDVTQSGPLFDAFNYNLPVIASNQDGFKEYITNGEDGLIFETNSVNSLASILNKCLMMSNSEYKKIENKFTKKSEIFSREYISEEYVKMYDQIISCINLE
jgi:glycosyltransferase involved in cell wall biosynthesis